MCGNPSAMQAVLQPVAAKSAPAEQDKGPAATPARSTRSQVRLRPARTAYCTTPRHGVTRLSSDRASTCDAKGLKDLKVQVSDDMTVAASGSARSKRKAPSTPASKASPVAKRQSRRADAVLEEEVVPESPEAGGCPAPAQSAHTSTPSGASPARLRAAKRKQATVAVAHVPSLGAADADTAKRRREDVDGVAAGSSAGPNAAAARQNGHTAGGSATPATAPSRALALPDPKLLAQQQAANVAAWASASLSPGWAQRHHHDTQGIPSWTFRQ